MLSSDPFACNAGRDQHPGVTDVIAHDLARIGRRWAEISASDDPADRSGKIRGLWIFVMGIASTGRIPPATILARQDFGATTTTLENAR